MPAASYRVLYAKLCLCVKNIVRGKDRSAVFANHLSLYRVLPEFAFTVQTVEVRLDEWVFLGIRIFELGHTFISDDVPKKYVVRPPPIQDRA